MVSNTINVKERERERKLLPSLSIGKAEGRKKKRIESKSIVSIFTILYTRLILSANHSNDRERKRRKNVALNRRERSAAFSSLPFWMYVRERERGKNAKKKIIIYKSSTGCML
jgi:hypothetical protein